MSDINIEIVESTPINLEIVATGPAGSGSGGGTVDSVVAGDNITVDATDPANPIVSAADQTYSEFIYNSGGSQVKNRYNSWSDLINEIHNGQYGPSRITFEQNETLPPGTYNLDDITLRGNGIPVLVGGLIITTTDVVISSWENARIEGGLGIGTAGSTPSITVSTTFTIELGRGAVIFGVGSAAFIKMVGTGTLIAYLDTGSGFYNYGAEPFEMVSTAEATIFANQPSTILPNDVFKGTTTGSRLKIIVGSSASQVDTTRSDANLSGGTASIRLAEMAELVNFDNSTNGFTATNVQDAIEAVVPYTGATTDVNLGTHQLTVHNIRPDASDGLLIESSGGADIALLGAGGGQNATFYDGVKLDGSTASRILSTDASKNITALDTTTYPSLTELAYVKGVTSAIQTQIDGKISASSSSVLTNKTLIASSNVTEEITSITSSATPTPTGGSLRNAFDVTALAVGATFGAPSGTPVHRNKLWITIKDNGGAQTLAWDSIYVAGGVALPTTTVAGKILNLGFIYNTNNSLNKWQLVASSQEA